MLKEVIELLSTRDFIDGRSLPDSAPGHTYHYRSCSPNIIVPAPHVRQAITSLLKEAGFKIKAGGGMLRLSR
jgi:hypothetical protein